MLTTNIPFQGFPFQKNWRYAFKITSISDRPRSALIIPPSLQSTGTELNLSECEIRKIGSFKSIIKLKLLVKLNLSHNYLQVNAHPLLQLSAARGSLLNLACLLRDSLPFGTEYISFIVMLMIMMMAGHTRHSEEAREPGGARHFLQ